MFLLQAITAGSTIMGAQVQASTAGTVAFTSDPCGSTIPTGWLAWKLFRVKKTDEAFEPGNYSLDVTGMSSDLHYAIELTGVSGTFSSPLPAADGMTQFLSFDPQHKTSALVLDIMFVTVFIRQ